MTLFFAGCAKGVIPMPDMVYPERNSTVLSEESYGTYPDDYKSILKDYLMKKLPYPEDARVEFVNKPGRLSINQLGNTYTGYRVCLSINARNKKNVFTGYKTHLFIIENSDVSLHLYDSGLLKIPFELCVEVDDTKSILIDDIDSKSTIDTMDEEIIRDIPDSSYIQNDVFLSCNIDDVERTFVFNEKEKLFYEAQGFDKFSYDVKFSNTHILASNENRDEILINRVSGTTTFSKGNLVEEGICLLLDKTKF
tara:strand:- start:4284 stop:5039 length:756 start_codon:yes stop_codon:yes gene_type:complete